MTFKKWLKKIVLFPLSIIMAIPDDGLNADALSDIAGDAGPTLGERLLAMAGDPNAQFHQIPPDAAASQADAADADQQGNQGDTTDEGLDTQSDEDGQDADSDEGDADDSTNQEPDDSGEGKKKGITQKNFDARMKEIEDRLEAKLISQRQAQIAEQPDFAAPEVVADVKRNLVKQMARIRELEADMELAGDDIDPKVVDELFNLQEFVADGKAALKLNDQRKAAWEIRQRTSKEVNTNAETARKELDAAAELYRAEMKITPEAWDRMGKWFADTIKTSKLVNEEFNDIYARSGKIAAIRFAHQYTSDNMGKATKQANEKKELNKTKTASLTASTTSKLAPINLDAERKRLYDTLPPDEAFMQFQALKRQARA